MTDLERIDFKHLFEQFWHQRKISRGTSTDYLRIYEKYLKQRFAEKSLSELSHERIWEEFFDELVKKGKIGCHRINRIHAVASAILTYAVEINHIKTNPLSKIAYLKEPQQKQKIWTKKQADLFLGHCAFYQCRYVFYTLIYNYCLRVSEVIALRWENIDRESLSLYIENFYCTQSKEVLPISQNEKRRTIRINTELFEMLALIPRSANHDFVFSNSKGMPQTPDSVRYQFRKDQFYSPFRGDSPIKLKQLRYSSICHLLNDGFDLVELKSFLGLRNTRSLNKYLNYITDSEK